ncbi:MAG: PadR family transcriptional regulator, partial [Saccharothrix sp.]|nr:PadR family transcriptional regulator [Saccharothrix sp.]
LVGLANQPVIPPGRLRDALARRADAVAGKIAELRAAVAAQPHAPRFARAIFDYSLAQLEAEQRWLAAYRAELTAPPDQEDGRP